MFVCCFVCRVFSFSNEERGVIKFEGNLLFTHFNEIGAPGRNPDPPIQQPEPTSSYKPPPAPTKNINLSPEDTGYSSTNM